MNTMLLHQRRDRLRVELKKGKKVLQGLSVKVQNLGKRISSIERVRRNLKEDKKNEILFTELYLFNIDIKGLENIKTEIYKKVGEYYTIENISSPELALILSPKEIRKELYEVVRR